MKTDKITQFSRGDLRARRHVRVYGVTKMSQK